MALASCTFENLQHAGTVPRIFEGNITKKKNGGRVGESNANWYISIPVSFIKDDNLHSLETE